MKEEKITLTLVKWLKAAGWEIVCIDFPQSGTGTYIHPNSDIRSEGKNMGAIVPDILAVKGEDSLYFENKDRFYLPDFVKLQQIKDSGAYSDGLLKLIHPRSLEKLRYVIGGPAIASFVTKATIHAHMVDVILTVDADGSVKTLIGDFVV